MKKLISLLLILSFVFCFAACGNSEGLDKNLDDYDYNINESIGEINSEAEEIVDKIYYSKGTFDGSIYENKWADIKFAIPEGFSNADSATYMTAENANTECGMYFIADNTMGFIYICYEKLPTFPVYNEEEYLDLVIKQLQGVDGITYKTPDTYSDTTISGHEYKKAECEFNNGNGDFAHTFFVRKLDNYMISVSIVGINSESNMVLANNITSIK